MTVTVGRKFPRLRAVLNIFFVSLTIFLFFLVVNESKRHGSTRLIYFIGGKHFSDVSLFSSSSISNNSNSNNGDSKSPSFEINPIQATPQQIVDYFYWTNRTSCGLIHDFGGQLLRNPSAIDGQKAVCLDRDVAPRPRKCLVYSFGVNYDWSFEDLMEKYGCEIFAFDPSTNATEDYNRTSMAHFYRIGLADRNHIDPVKHWKMRTLKTIYSDLLNHTGRIIDYLKIDIETSEWTVLPEILASGMFSKVRQLAIEFHWPGDEGSLETYRSLTATVKALEDAGMVRFDSKPNPWCPAWATALDDYEGPVCFEIAWYQILPF